MEVDEGCFAQALWYVYSSFQVSLTVPFEVYLTRLDVSEQPHGVPYDASWNTQYR